MYYVTSPTKSPPRLQRNNLDHHLTPDPFPALSIVVPEPGTLLLLLSGLIALLIWRRRK